MNKRAGSFGFAAVRLGAWFRRFAFMLLLFVSFVLIALDYFAAPSLLAVRVSVADAVAPIIGLAMRPVVAFNDIVETAQDYVALKSENAELRRQNGLLRSARITAARLEGENEALRSLLNMPGVVVPKMVSSRVVADQSGSFLRSVLVGVGRSEGVEKGQVAMTGDGLAGRVSEVGDVSSRVVLITDISSRIPVFVGVERHHAILAGDNSSYPYLRHLDRGAAIRKGDLVYSSGDGEVLPADLPVGTVFVDEKGFIRVKPFVDFSGLDFLRLEDYALVRRFDVLFD